LCAIQEAGLGPVDRRVQFHATAQVLLLLTLAERDMIGENSN